MVQVCQNSAGIFCHNGAVSDKVSVISHHLFILTSNAIATEQMNVVGEASKASSQDLHQSLDMLQS